MILHTVINYDDVFYKQTPVGSYHKNGNCLIEVYSFDGENRIRHIFSTNPYDYLNGNYYPETKYNPKFKGGNYGFH